MTIKQEVFEATKAYQSAIAKNGQIYTTDYVLDETFTFFFRRLYVTRAEQSMKSLLSAFSINFISLELISEFSVLFFTSIKPR
ncbi:MAG: hypothetical protein IGS23_04225 [Rivularia sp. T60_A2020_040]|nr:hypothetical protein [Rivularia sp. T60_A2020_040]